MLNLNLNNKTHVFISDIHFFHKNIMRFEPIRMWLSSKDEDFFEDETIDRTEMNNELKNIDNNIMNWLTFQLQLINMDTPIDTIYFWGDFFFNFNKSKFEKLNYDFSKIEEFVKKLPGKKVLILGNHDDTQFLDWYNKMFDEIKKYEIFKHEDNNTIFLVSHYPLGDFEREDNVPKLKSEKVLAEVDKELVEKYYMKNNQNMRIVNIHWHTHSKSPVKPLDWVEYVNMSIENFLD